MMLAQASLSASVAVTNWEAVRLAGRRRHGGLEWISRSAGKGSTTSAFFSNVRSHLNAESNARSILAHAAERATGGSG